VSSALFVISVKSSKCKQFEVSFLIMKDQAIIFDWDGTLSNSTGRIVESLQLASRDAQLRELSEFELKQIIGLGLPEALRQLWPELDGDITAVDKMRELYAKHYMSEMRSTISFFEHAGSMLDNLLKADLDLAVATGKSRVGLDRAFKELKAGHWFRASRCADETKSKPHPLMLNELAASLSVAPENMLMVGDTTFDLEMANAAGIDAVAITHGAHHLDKLMACNPVHVVHDLKQLNDWLI
jgi:phosphoglycolate phosphatase